jgi:hypothetical protein
MGKTTFRKYLYMTVSLLLVLLLFSGSLFAGSVDGKESFKNGKNDPEAGRYPKTEVEYLS